jgi:hypothetical protein
LEFIPSKIGVKGAIKNKTQGDTTVKNRTLLLVLLTVGFVGATSCGQDNTAQQLASENAALRLAINQRATAVAAVGVTVTQIATSVVNVTVTSASSSVNTSSQTNVVYTVTGISIGTSTLRQ